MDDFAKVKTQREVASGWLDITLTSLRDAMDKKGISSTRKELYASIAGNLIEGSNGDVEMIRIQFLLHGRFVDMGVGRGKKLGSNAISANDIFHKPRRPKKWYSPTMQHEVFRLADLMNELTGQQGINMLESELKGSFEMRI